MGNENKMQYFAVKDAGVEIKDGERAVISHISSGAVDRDKEILVSKGVNLSNYRKNPVVLWAHDSRQPPIGKNQWVRKTDTEVIAKTIFAETPRGDEIYELYKGGYLKAFSVGFIPDFETSKEPDENDIKRHPEWAGARRVFTRWELLEYSAVPVPANPEALATAVGKGLCVSDDLQEQLGFAAFVDETEELIQELKAVIPYKQTPVDGADTEWKASEEIKAAETDDLKIMCTWVDSENADKKTAYKLPHHRADGEHNTVWLGVVSAMAKLMGAGGGVNVPKGDRKGIYEHLAKHYAEFEKQPPEFKESPIVVTSMPLVVPMIAHRIFDAQTLKPNMAKIMREEISKAVNTSRGKV